MLEKMVCDLRVAETGCLALVKIIENIGYQSLLPLLPKKHNILIGTANVAVIACLTQDYINEGQKKCMGIFVSDESGKDMIKLHHSWSIADDPHRDIMAGMKFVLILYKDSSPVNGFSCNTVVLEISEGLIEKKRPEIRAPWFLKT